MSTAPHRPHHRHGADKGVCPEVATHCVKETREGESSHFHVAKSGVEKVLSNIEGQRSSANGAICLPRASILKDTICSLSECV